MESWLPLLIVPATLGCGLVAGFFFAFSNTVMGALGRMPPAQGAAVMRHVNVVVLNPIFFLAFFGTGALALGIALLAVARLGEPQALVAFVASLVYLAGSIGVTMAANVPMNNALAAADPAAPQTSELWARYLVRWTAWNHVRTLACVGATVLYALALI